VNKHAEILLEVFSLKKANEVERKKECGVEICSRFAALETEIMMWVLIELRKLLEIIQKFFTNLRSINQVLTKDIPNYWIKGTSQIPMVILV
jgi:hypothetical protein